MASYTLSYYAPGLNFVLSRVEDERRDYFTLEDLQEAVINEPLLVLAQGENRRVELDHTLCTNIVVGSAKALLDTLYGLASAGGASGTSLTAFGELRVSEPTPVLDLSFVTGVEHPQKVTVYSEGTGAVSYANSRADLTVAAVDDVILLTSKDRLPYRPGIGSIFRFTAVFPDIVTGTRILAGCGTPVSGLFFGFNGTGGTFGVMQRSGGVQHVQEFTITTAAGGAETATVTLDGTAFNFPLTLSGGDLEFTAFEIGITRAVGDWTVQAIGDQLIFTSVRAGVRSGAYSFSSTGAATATNSTVETGVANTETFIAETAWTGGQDLTQAIKERGNTYEIAMLWGGYGTIQFRIQNALTGRMETVHTIQNAGAAALPFFAQPHLQLMYEMEMLSLTTPAPVLSTTSGVALIDGKEVFTSPVHTASFAIQAFVNTGETYFWAWRIEDTYNGAPNLHQCRLTRFNVVSNSGRQASWRIYKNPTIGATGPTDPLDYPQWAVTEADSMVAVDTSGLELSFSGGDVIKTFGLAPDSAEDFHPNIIMQPGDVFLVSRDATNTGTEAAVVLEWSQEGM